ncbi:MAG: glycosyltransferase family 2 protein [Patescibacteria group bacterium]|nr:glycosyltransferase family 2 protein [Patescibacteria group bacterium]
MKFSDILRVIKNFFKKKASVNKDACVIKTVDIRFSDIPRSVYLVIKKYGWAVFFRKLAIILKKYPYRKKFTYCKGKTKGFFQKLSRKTKYLFGAAFAHYRKEGFASTAKCSLNYVRYGKGKPEETPDFSAYETWIQKYEKKDEDEARKIIGGFSTSPKISIILPVFNADEIFLRKAIFSVINQYYQNWELRIVDNASNRIIIKKILSQFAERDSRIKIEFFKNKEDFSTASNRAAETATGEFVAFLGQNDALAPDALLESVRAINEKRNADVFYSDEDNINENEIRFDYNFKPDWSPELIVSQGYVGNLLLVRKEIFVRIGGFRDDYSGAEKYNFLLKLSENVDGGIHIPKVLYHNRVFSDEKKKPVSAENGRLSLESALRRRMVKGRADIPDFAEEKNILNYKIEFSPEDFNEKVTIIIPTKDKVDLLENCVESIKKKTNYPNYEILVVNNNSEEKKTLDFLKNKKIKYFDIPTKEFDYSRIHNLAIEKIETELILLLNNDTEVISLDWLTAMVGTMLLDKKIGAVGARLIYSDKKIQHGGVVLGPHSTADHANKNMYFEESGYQNYNLVMRNYSAVTAACMLTRKSLFEKMGGFDEKNLSVAFNDIDYCLNLLQNGYRIVYNPDALLYHYESKSRGDDHNLEEPRYFTNKWKKIIEKDPYYNVNLSLENVRFELKKN